MRTVVIVLLDPACDAQFGLAEVLVLVEPFLLFFQAAMKPFEVAVAFGVMIRRPSISRAQQLVTPTRYAQPTVGPPTSLPPARPCFTFDKMILKIMHPGEQFLFS